MQKSTLRSLTAAKPKMKAATLSAATRLITRPLLANGRSGCIAAAEPDALASAVRAILEAPCAPEKVAEAAEPFSWDRSAARMEAHLRALVALHRNSLRRGGEIGGTNAWVA